MKKDWTYKKLGEVCDFISDGDWIEKKDQSTSGIRLIQTGNIGVGRFIPKDDSQKFISEETFKRLKCCEIFEGDVLISRLPNPLGRSCILPKLGTKCITAVDCTILRLKEDTILPDLFLYYTQSQGYFTKIDSESSGTTRARITRKKLEETTIPLPPLSEQERIVSRLDAAFGEIEGLKAKAEAQLREARTLFQAALTQEMKPKQGWEEKKLSEIVHPQCSLSYGIVQPGDHIEDGVPVVRPVDFNNQITVSVEGLKRTKKEISDAYKRTILNGGEILFCVRGTTGTMGLASEELKGCNVTRGIVPMFFANNTDLMFVFYQLLSPKLQEEIQKKTTGAALKQINIKDLRNLLLSLPPLPVQQQIVSRLDALSEKVRELEEAQKKTLAECDNLKQALLREVFE